MVAKRIQCKDECGNPKMNVTTQNIMEVFNSTAGTTLFKGVKIYFDIIVLLF